MAEIVNDNLTPEVTSTLLVASRYFLAVAARDAPESFREVLRQATDPGVTIVWRGTEPSIFVTATLDGVPHTLEVPVVIEAPRKGRH